MSGDACFSCVPGVAGRLDLIWINKSIEILREIVYSQKNYVFQCVSLKVCLIHDTYCITRRKFTEVAVNFTDV